jgi:nucleotide-binding universal stress UspA family protein
LLKSEECTFYLLHTYTPAVYQAEYVLHSPGQIGLGDSYQANALENLDQLKAELKKAHPNPNHSFYTHTANNFLADEVADVVEKEGINLVVLGTQGATGAKEVFFGTHAVRVLKRVKCPALVIPPGVVFENPDTILFPTDYKVDFRSLPLITLHQIANRAGSVIEVIHISTDIDLDEHQGKNKQFLKVLLKDVHSKFHDLPAQGILQGINSFRKPVKLLVMVKNKHSFLEQLFKEAVIEKIAFHVNIPFMVIPAPS